MHRAPDHHGGRARIQPAGEQGRQPGDDGAERVHQVGRQVRPGGVAARPEDPQIHHVRGGGDGAGLEPDPAGLQPRIAVQREQSAHPVQRAGGDHIVRAAGKDLLGGLEDQPHPAADVTGPGQRPGGTEQHGEVHVVAAGMRDLRQRRGVGQSGRLRDRQRVDVGAQPDHLVAAADLGDDAGAGRDQPGLDPVGLQRAQDQRAGGRLPVTQLGVRMHPASQVDEFGQIGAQHVVQPARAATGTLVRHLVDVRNRGRRRGYGGHGVSHPVQPRRRLAAIPPGRDGPGFGWRAAGPGPESITRRPAQDGRPCMWLATATAPPPFAPPQPTHPAGSGSRRAGGPPWATTSRPASTPASSDRPTGRRCAGAWTSSSGCWSSTPSISASR